MKIYVAGSWHERERAKAFAEQLRALGHDVPHSWWDNEHDAKSRPAQAYADIWHASRCEMIVVLVSPKHTMRGAWTELGASLAHGHRALVVGSADQAKECFFTYHPNVRVVGDDERALAGFHETAALEAMGL